MFGMWDLNWWGKLVDHNGYLKGLVAADFGLAQCFHEISLVASTLADDKLS